MADIRPAELPGDLEVVRSLFREYAESLGVDLGFQDFEVRLTGLPGNYVAARRSALACRTSAEPVGCVALRPLTGGACEMKRLYVQPRARGEQLGRRLAERICDEARDAGYVRICLDTLPGMSAAIRLYETLGLKPVEPYTYNPVPGVLFLARELSGTHRP